MCIDRSVAVPAAYVKVLSVTPGQSSLISQRSHLEFLHFTMYLKNCSETARFDAILEKVVKCVFFLGTLARDT